jgi:hypothetical protein
MKVIQSINSKELSQYFFLQNKQKKIEKKTFAKYYI